MQGKRAQQLRRVPSNSPRLPVEEVEVFRLSELLSLCDACGKIFPGDDASIAAKGSPPLCLAYSYNPGCSAGVAKSLAR